MPVDGGPPTPAAVVVVVVVLVRRGVRKAWMWMSMLDPSPGMPTPAAPLAGTEMSWR